MSAEPPFLPGDAFITNHCPHCSGNYEFPADGVGQLVPCPHCGQEVKLGKPLGQENISGIIPMNRKQRFVAWLWGITMLVLTAVPPWTNRGKREFAFILSPPDYYSIEFGMLILEWVIVSMVFAGLLLAFRTKHTAKRPGILKRLFSWAVKPFKNREWKIQNHLKKPIAREGLIILSLAIITLTFYALHNWQQSKMVQYDALPKLIGKLVPKFVPPSPDTLVDESSFTPPPPKSLPDFGSLQDAPVKTDFIPNAKPKASAKGLFDDLIPPAPAKTTSSGLFDDIPVDIPFIRAHKIDLEPKEVSFSFPKGTKEQVIRSALKRDYGDADYIMAIHSINKGNLLLLSKYAFSENYVSNIKQVDVLDEVFAVPYDSKGNRIKRIEDELFYRLPFKRLSIVLLAFAYPLYWLIRFVVWAVKTLRIKEESNAVQ